MDPVDIGRWQFGITTVYHFLMVPLTIGLGLVVALMQTMWYRTKDERYLRMTKFWGKLFLINFIMGVATGIVQEFQFGMAWSEYSRFVGDVFGAPLALEALIAFFAESTFLGLWIFGWKRLKPGLHLATLWAAVIGATASAYFIIAANSWMQHPVGVDYVEVNGRMKPQMNSIWAVLSNNTAVSAYLHTITGALAVAGSFLLGISWYHLWKRQQLGLDGEVTQGKPASNSEAIPGRDRTDHAVWLTSLRWGTVIGLIAFIGVAVFGDTQARLMFQQQPMKMAAAEAICSDGNDFSLLSIGNPGTNNCDDVTTVLSIPGLLGFLADGDFNATISGVDTLIPQYQEQYGQTLPEGDMYGDRSGQDVDYMPLMIVTYWGFRFMIGFGVLAAAACVVAWWMARKGTISRQKWLMRLALLAITFPFLANSFGWIFTEMGRQPFVVAPNPTGVDGVYMYTAAAVSPGVSAIEMLISLITLTLVYGVLLVVEVKLLFTYVKGGVPSAMPELIAPTDADDSHAKDDVLAFAY